MTDTETLILILLVAFIALMVFTKGRALLWFIEGLSDVDLKDDDGPDWD